MCSRAGSVPVDHHLAEINVARLRHPLHHARTAEFVNYSIWRNLESLDRYVFKSHYVDYLRRRRDWFERGDQPATCRSPQSSER